MGKKVRPHFAHGHSANCSQESIIHATAKSVIVAEIEKEPREICFVRSCPKCGSKKEQPIPEKIITAEEEVTSGPFRVDIGLFSKKGLEAAIEVRVTHEVDERKKKKLLIPFIEVDGETVITNPAKLLSIFDTFQSWRCLNCLEKVRKLMELINQVSKETGIIPPKFPYITGVQYCSNCHKRCLVFCTSNLTEAELKNHQTRPRTLKFYNARKNGGFGWHNHCSRCGYMLNNGLLHSLTHGAFAGIGGGGNEAQIYETMAFYADYNGLL